MPQLVLAAMLVMAMSVLPDRSQTFRSTHLVLAATGSLAEASVALAVVEVQVEAFLETWEIEAEAS